MSLLIDFHTANIGFALIFSIPSVSCFKLKLFLPVSTYNFSSYYFYMGGFAAPYSIPVRKYWCLQMPPLRISASPYYTHRRWVYDKNRLSTNPARRSDVIIFFVFFVVLMLYFSHRRHRQLNFSLFIPIAVTWASYRTANVIVQKLVRAAVVDNTSSVVIPTYCTDIHCCCISEHIPVHLYYTYIPRFRHFCCNHCVIDSYIMDN